MNHASNAAATKHELRESLKATRHRLSALERAPLDLRICAHLQRLLEPVAALDLAAYSALRGEPDLSPVLAALHAVGHRVHLPVLADDQLQFRRWSPDARLSENRYGIPEPLHGELCAAPDLAWVLLPLVAFSAVGGRLGMGGGYYDRTFSFCLDQPAGRRPRLFGIAYAWQQVDSLPLEPWDVPLDGVVTDRGVLWPQVA